MYINLLSFLVVNYFSSSWFYILQEFCAKLQKINDMCNFSNDFLHTEKHEYLYNAVIQHITNIKVAVSRY